MVVFIHGACNNDLYTRMQKPTQEAKPVSAPKWKLTLWPRRVKLWTSVLAGNLQYFILAADKPVTVVS